MKLFNQLEQVDKATPLALSDDGNISGNAAVSKYHLWEVHGPYTKITYRMA